MFVCTSSIVPIKSRANHTYALSANLRTRAGTPFVLLVGRRFSVPWPASTPQARFMMMSAHPWPQQATAARRSAATFASSPWPPARCRFINGLVGLAAGRAAHGQNAKYGGRPRLDRVEINAQVFNAQVLWVETSARREAPSWKEVNGRRGDRVT